MCHIWLLWFVSFVWLNQSHRINQKNQMNQTNQSNQPVLPLFRTRGPLDFRRAGIVFSQPASSLTLVSYSSGTGRFPSSTNDCDFL
jgi:hypothetical protein